MQCCWHPHSTVYEYRSWQLPPSFLVQSCWEDPGAGHLELFISANCGHFPLLASLQHLYCPPLNRDPMQVLSQWEWNEWDASTEGN